MVGNGVGKGFRKVPADRKVIACHRMIQAEVVFFKFEKRLPMFFRIPKGFSIWIGKMLNEKDFPHIMKQPGGENAIVFLTGQIPVNIPGDQCGAKRMMPE